MTVTETQAGQPQSERLILKIYHQVSRKSTHEPGQGTTDRALTRTVTDLAAAGLKITDAIQAEHPHPVAMMVSGGENPALTTEEVFMELSRRAQSDRNSTSLVEVEVMTGTVSDSANVRAEFDPTIDRHQRPVVRFVRFIDKPQTR